MFLPYSVYSCLLTIDRLSNIKVCFDLEWTLYFAAVE
jgi:hypothetical protein